MDGPPVTDALVLRAQAGDLQAYDRLFERVAERVLLYVHLRLGKALRAKVDPVDILQDVYLVAHEAFPRFELREPGSLSPWLCTIVDNRIRQLAQHFGAQKRTPPGGKLGADSVIARIRKDETGPATAFARQERHRKLIDAVEDLEPDAREVVLGRFFQGRTFEDLAESLGKSERSVRRLLEKSLLQLGQLLPRD